MDPNRPRNDKNDNKLMMKSWVKEKTENNETRNDSQNDNDHELPVL